VRCLLVGVLNCTPDSFSDGGRHSSVEAAVAAGVAMAEAGANWIDVGGESTRPGAVVVPEADERARVIPVIEGLRRALSPSVRISIDTYKAGTAQAAVAAGASVINDVSGGLLDPEILAVAGKTGAGIVLGHLRGAPATMMENISFVDVVREVGAELEERLAAARAAGCYETWVDPGIGFGKRFEENIALLRGLPALGARLEVPMMVGVSRKAFIGQVTGKPASARQFGTAAAVTVAVLGGAAAVRVHDVAEMSDVVKVALVLASPGAPNRA
jgi:dihydropteroate synthase